MGRNFQKNRLSATTGLRPTPDPYDLWATPVGLLVKKNYYNGKLSGKAGAIIVGLLDWLIPSLSRNILKTERLIYPISFAQEVLRLSLQKLITSEESDFFLKTIQKIAADNTEGNFWAWGLGFPWMSKNGLYGRRLPFITHTPYVMEALLKIVSHPKQQEQAQEMFLGTWGFLESLKIMHESDDALALSYAPVNEPRTVINANSYAALAYALHAKHGLEGNKELAIERVKKLVNWIVDQQHKDGSWFYYAEGDQGNFVDCFHSCFIIKNLLKVKLLLPEVINRVYPAVQLGWSFMQNNFYDKKSRLCRRFVQRDIKDPFRWDLYDQAEYLGLLVDFGLLDTAEKFAMHVESKFHRKNNWYCRFDILGRRWGKNFQRWGIVPFLYHKTRLAKATGEL